MKSLITALLTALLTVFTWSTASAQLIAGAELESFAVAKVESVLDERGDFRRREISLVRNVIDVEVPDGYIDVVSSLAGSLNLTGYTPVTLRVTVDGRPVRTLNVTLKVRVFDTVLVTSRDLRFDEPITENDFRIEEIAVDGRTESVKDFNEIKGLVPIRTIRAGSPVTLALFQAALVIEAGQPVRIVSKFNGVEVAAKGISMARGRVGKVIRVRNESSGKILSGRVIDSQTVEVIF